MQRETLTHSEGNIDLHVDTLSIGYKKKSQEHVVASNITFKVNQGQLVGIVGVNGIGKTTLLRTLSGMQDGLEGSVLLNRQTLDSYSSKVLSTMLSVVLTEPLPTKNLTVYELVSLGRQPYTNWLGRLGQDDNRIVKDVLNRLGIKDLADKKCYELSDGQLQKVLLGRALAQDTPLMMLDEPTTHLDLYHKVHILKILREIAHDLKKLVIFTTHEIELAIQLCDTLCVLNSDGMDFGSPSDLIDKEKFNNLFPPDTLTFNAATGKFSIRET